MEKRSDLKIYEMKTGVIFFILSAISLEASAQTSQRIIPYRIGNKWGYANEQKGIIIPAVYDSAGLFSFNKEKLNVAKVRSAKSYYYLNEFGDSVVADVKDKRYFDIQLYGMILNSLRKIQRELDVKLSFFKKNGKYGYRIKNDTILKAKFTDVGHLDRDIMQLKSRKRWILYDSTGSKLSSRYDSIGDTAARIAIIVLKNGKYGLINRKGKLIISKKYDELLHLFPSMKAIIAKQGNKYGLINFKGEVILPFKYTRVDPLYYFEIGCFLFENETGQFCFVSDRGTEYCE